LKNIKCHHSIKNFISNTNVGNCNDIFWAKNENEEAKKVLVLGKNMGMSLYGCKDNIEDDLLCSEKKGSSGD